jgi:hypothetical protein
MLSQLADALDDAVHAEIGAVLQFDAPDVTARRRCSASSPNIHDAASS